VTAARPYGLFERFGIELEYMLVDAASLNVVPWADWLLHELAGEYASEIECQGVSWSNELVNHVLELKSSEPAKDLAELLPAFERGLADVQARLQARGARLLPSGMHPWMNPARETVLWPHEYAEVYRTFDRIFDCRRHGWANLQSVHLNLPFADDEQFARLNAAVRLVLPLLPALAASSPFCEGAATGWLDTRLETYRTNSAHIPQLTGQVIPEPVYSQTDYEQQIFAPMRAAIRPHDPEGVLEHEFLNSRGAIARFARGSLEIRLLDVQECPLADLAIVTLVVRVLVALVAERWQPLAWQQAWPVKPLADLLQQVARTAEETPLVDLAFLSAFGERDAMRASSLWSCLRRATLTAADEALFGQALDVILEHGTLATRLVRAVGPDANAERLRQVYGQLADCLAAGRLFGTTDERNYSDHR